MRIVIFTSNARRHTYVANTLSRHTEAALVISESRGESSRGEPKTPTEKHFAERDRIEQKFFPDDVFAAEAIELPYGEANSPEVYEKAREFAPDMGFVFGASVIREPLLSLIPSGRFVNMHLGLSPYYRGSGTNFWPFINEELEYVGATLLHIDAGIDTGDIIAHVRPTIELGDTVHTIGCKTIMSGTKKLLGCMDLVRSGKELPRVKQRGIPNARYYRNSDFTDEIALEYLRKIEGGLIEKHLARKPATLKLVEM